MRREEEELVHKIHKVAVKAVNQTEKGGCNEGKDCSLKHMHLNQDIYRGESAFLKLLQF